MLLRDPAETCENRTPWAKATGGDDREVAKLGGWKTTAAMNRYIVTVDERMRRVSQNVAAVFAPAKKNQDKNRAQVAQERQADGR